MASERIFTQVGVVKSLSIIKSNSFIPKGKSYLKTFTGLITLVTLRHFCKKTKQMNVHLLYGTKQKNAQLKETLFSMSLILKSVDRAHTKRRTPTIFSPLAVLPFGKWYRSISNQTVKRFLSSCSDGLKLTVVTALCILIGPFVSVYESSGGSVSLILIGCTYNCVGMLA